MKPRRNGERDGDGEGGASGVREHDGLTWVVDGLELDE